MCTKMIPKTLLNYTPLKLLQWISGDLGWGRTHSANKIYIFASVVREIHRQPTATLLFTVVLCVFLR